MPQALPSPDKLSATDALWADIARQMQEAVTRRLDPARIARRNAVLTIKERALRDAGVTLDARELVP